MRKLYLMILVFVSVRQPLSTLEPVVQEEGRSDKLPVVANDGRDFYYAF